MTNHENRIEPWSRRDVGSLVACGILVLVSRLPWVMAGPGPDPDSFRILGVAYTLAETGEYSFSRPPGYPAYEYLAATLVRFGALGTNMISALLSVMAFVFLALILRQSQVRHHLAGALGFAFAPVVYVNSTNTIDYVPAVAVVLAATYFLLNRRFIVAGMFLGLAVGIRITSGAMLIPFLIWMVLDSNRPLVLRRALQLGIGALAVAGFCFLPVFLKYGTSFFTFHDNAGYPSLRTILDEGVLSVWGPLGTLALAGLLLSVLLRRREIKSGLHERRVFALVSLAATSIALYLIVFLRLPHEPGYLVPVIPFAILVFGLIVPGAQLKWFAVAVGLSSLGPVVKDHADRVAIQNRAEEVIARVDQLPEAAVVVAAWHLPAIETELRSRRRSRDQYVYLVENKDDCASYEEEGRHVYFLRGMDDYNMRIHGVDLSQCNARLLDVPGKD
jgi:hypothetical protein